MKEVILIETLSELSNGDPRVAAIIEEGSPGFLGGLPFAQLSCHSNVDEPFFTFLEVQKRKASKLGINPPQKKDLFLMGICSSVPGSHPFR